MLMCYVCRLCMCCTQISVSFCLSSLLFMLKKYRWQLSSSENTLQHFVPPATTANIVAFVGLLYSCIENKYTLVHSSKLCINICYCFSFHVHSFILFSIVGKVIQQHSAGPQFRRHMPYK